MRNKKNHAKEIRCVCKGLLCMPHDRKFKCVSCAQNMCGISTIRENGKDYCVGCWLKTFMTDFNEGLIKAEKNNSECDYLKDKRVSELANLEA